MLDRIRVVLVQTTHPGNIGAAARAMKTMGLSQLFLVTPKLFPHAEATAMASGAADLLATARVVGSLEEALADTSLAVAASARQRHIPWPHLEARQGAALLAQESEFREVAIVFGREDRGLTNEELHLCQYHVSIPSNPEYGVLNVAAALQVLAYELRMAHAHQQGEGIEASARMPLGEARWDEDLVSGAEMQLFYEHFEQVLIQIGFLSAENPRQLMVRVKRMFSRIRMDRMEHNMMRGMLKDIQHQLGRQVKD